MKEIQIRIEEILSKLANDKFTHMVWIGKSYSIKDLRNDLNEILKKTGEKHD